MPLQLRFIKTSGIISTGIAWETNSLWDHVELQTPGGTYIGAHAGGGIQERPSDYCKPTRERRYSIPCSDSQQHGRIYDWAKSKVGTPYNFLDILGLAIHDRKFSDPTKDICSQFVIQAAVQGGIWLLNVQPGFDYLITPETLHLSPVLIGRCTYDSP